MNRPLMAYFFLSFISWAGFAGAGEPVYKWTDAEGRVHYSQKKPAATTEAQPLHLPPTGSAASASAPTDPDAEVARLKALSETLARERQATEQARQEQWLRAMQLSHQQLQNQLLEKQLQEEQAKAEAAENAGVGGIVLDYYPPPYAPAYPYRPPHRRPHPSLPYRPEPPDYGPCEPWPDCRHPRRPRPSPPPAKAPIPPFNPKAVGADLRADGFIRQP